MAYCLAAQRFCSEGFWAALMNCVFCGWQIIGIYFVAMLAADSGEIDAVKDEAQS